MHTTTDKQQAAVNDLVAAGYTPVQVTTDTKVHLTLRVDDHRKPGRYHYEFAQVSEDGQVDESWPLDVYRTWLNKEV